MPLTNRAIFNAVYDSLSPTFQNRIPKMDAQNMRDIGMMITSDQFTAEFNEWLSAAVNRIGMVIIHNNELTNRLGRFIYGTMEFGDAIEELMVDTLKGEDYRPGVENGSIDPFRITNPNVKAIYHKVNSRRMYRVTTYPERAKKAFLNEGGLQRLLDQIINQLYSAANLDDWLSTKNIFNSFINATGNIAPKDTQKINVDAITSEQSAKDFVNSVKNIVTAMSFPTAQYNIMGMTKMVNPSDLTIFIRADLLNYIDVNVLSSAFNRSDLNFTPNDSQGFMKMVAMDNFGGLVPVDSSGQDLQPMYDIYGKTTGQYELPSAQGSAVDVASWKDPNANVLAIITEDRFPLITRQVDRADSIWNPEGLYWNNFLHRWSQYGYSGFMNAVILQTAS